MCGRFVFDAGTNFSSVSRHFNAVPGMADTLLKKNVMLPQGVTRHVINGRVLRLNYPIEMLKKGTPEREKQTFFADFLKHTNLRYYEESTYMAE